MKFLICAGLVFCLGACAAKSTSQALKSEPRNEKASIQYDFAFDAYMNGEMIPALGAALKTIELAPNNAESYNLLGLIYFRQNKFELAEEAFKKATSLDGKLSEAYNNLGSLYLSQDKFAQAKEALLLAQDNPLYLYPERIQNNLGLAFEGLKQPAEAEKSYREAIRLSKDFYLPYVNYGRLLVRRGEFARAETLLKDAVRTCSDCSEPRYLLGQILTKAGRREEAIKMFTDGAKIDPYGQFGQLCQESLTREK